jgi:hypothetical protein
MVWLTYIAWHHMKALGLVDCTHEEFESKRCVAVSTEDDETAAPPHAVIDTDDGPKEVPVVPPTRPDLDIVSQSS